MTCEEIRVRFLRDLLEIENWSLAEIVSFKKHLARCESCLDFVCRDIQRHPACLLSERARQESNQATDRILRRVNHALKHDEELKFGLITADEQKRLSEKLREVE